MIRTLAVCLTLTLVTAVHADERERLFEGLGIKLEKITDAMTDKMDCVLFVEQGPIYLGVTPARVNIFTNSDELLLAFDSKHLIRVGDAKPVELEYLSKQNGLAVTDATTAAKVVKALATTKPAKSCSTRKCRPRTPPP